MFALITAFSLIMSLVLLTAMGLYVVRSWNQLRAEEPGSIHHEILDRLDRIEMRLDLLSERMPGALPHGQERPGLPGAGGSGDAGGAGAPSDGGGGAGRPGGEGPSSALLGGPDAGDDDAVGPAPPDARGERI